MKLSQLTEEQILSLAKAHFNKDGIDGEHVKSKDDIEVSWDKEYVEPILCIKCKDYFADNVGEMLCIDAQGALWCMSTEIWDTYGLTGHAHKWLVANKVEPFYQEQKSAAFIEWKLHDRTEKYDYPYNNLPKHLLTNVVARLLGQGEMGGYLSDTITFFKESKQLAPFEAKAVEGTEDIEFKGWWKLTTPLEDIEI
jgi:hypothetical protein